MAKERQVVAIEIVNDHTEEILEAMREQVQDALIVIGETAEGYAKEDTPVDTGRLRNSITYATKDFGGVAVYSDDQGNNFYDGDSLHTPEENTLYMGTNVEYGVYVEYGSYNHKVGKPHFIRDAMSTHGEEYKEILRASLDR